MSVEEAIAYVQRGRGERKWPTSGWPSSTPAERDVARLIYEGLANKEVATRLFVSPCTGASTSQPHLRQTRHHVARPARARGDPPQLMRV